MLIEGSGLDFHTHQRIHCGQPHIVTCYSHCSPLIKAKMTRISPFAKEKTDIGCFLEHPLGMGQLPFYDFIEIGAADAFILKKYSIEIGTADIFILKNILLR